MKKWLSVVAAAALVFMSVPVDSHASAEKQQVAVNNTATTDTTNGPRTMDSDIRTDRVPNNYRVNTYNDGVTDNLFNRTYDRDVVDGMRTRAYDANYRTTAVDNDMDWGWLGILGLIGLAGLAGRNRNPQGER